MLKGKNKLVVFIIISFFCSINTTLAYFSSSSSINNKFYTSQYNLKLIAEAGNFSTTNAYVKNNKLVLPIPSRQGYEFKGYIIDSDTSIIYSNEISDTNKIRNKNLYALWNLKSYSITYNLNGGSISGQKTGYNTEETFTLPTPTKTGNTFLGWTGSNGSSNNKNVTISAGTTGNLTYTANWSVNSYKVDVNPVIQNTAYNSGLSGFTFNVYVDGTSVASNVIDWNSNVKYGSKVRVVANSRDGYNITANKDQTQTVGVNGLTFKPTWYDNIPPTITSFKVTNLGYYDPSVGSKKGWNIRVYINGYDNGTGIQKYQTWLAPYGNGTGAARKDGNDRTMTNVLYLNTTSGRKFCAYAIDKAGNESEKCETIKV